MKNNKWIFSIFTIVVLMFVSCKDSLLQNYNDTSSTGTISISVNASSARNILPDTSVTDFTDFVLTGSSDGETYSTLGSWNSYYELSAAVIELNPGNWKFNLSAQRAGISFTASTRITVQAGQNVTADFALSTSSTENGTANITLRYPKQSNVGIVAWIISEINTYPALIQSGSEVASGYCYSNPLLNQGDAVQQITDTAFTLKTDVPAGKYLFTCIFGYAYGESEGGAAGYGVLGNYYNYIVIQPGLESKVDYTIDYFELLGITDCESKEDGMYLTVEVPKGVESILIERITNFNEVMSSWSEEAMTNNVISFVKMLETPTTSSTTMTFVDSYGYTAGQKLTYAVFYNYFSEENSGAYYVKDFTADYNGYTVPGFSTYPEFAIESNAEGKTTKIKLVNEPVIDWKGHELDSDYMIILSQDYQDVLMFERAYILTKDVKEKSVNPNDLHAGPNPLTGYRLGFEKDGWYYNCGVDKSGLSGAQLPVLYGRPNAIPTDRGIDIEVYCDWQRDVVEEGNEKVKLLRSTDPYSGYITIKDYAYASGQNFIYTDKKNLQKDVTYYYKLVGESGTVYGGPYFSATSSVNYGIPLTITTNPKLEVSANSVATFTPGTYQFDEHLARYDIYYDFKQSDNNNKMIRIIRENYISNGEWVAPDLRAMIWEYDEDGRVHGFAPFDHSTQTNSKNLYYEPLDGKQYVFDKAYIECYDSYDGYGTLIDVINFTPSAQECPSSFVIHTDVIQFDTESTEDGITISIRNIPEEADSISVVSRYATYYDYELFRVNNLNATTLNLLDFCVNQGGDYSYTILAYDGDTLLDYATSATKGQYCYNGGTGRPGFAAYNDGKVVEIVFDSVTDDSCVIYREGLFDRAIITPAQGKEYITDYFVQYGKTYNYTLSKRIDYNGNDSIIYTPRSTQEVYVPYSEGYFFDYPKITKIPEYTYVVDESNNLAVTFTGTPQVSVKYQDDPNDYSLLPEFTVSRLDLFFKYDSLHDITVPYTGSNTETYPVELFEGLTFRHDLQSDSFGIFTCSDYTYEGYAFIPYDSLIIDTEQGRYNITMSGYIIK